MLFYCSEEQRALNRESDFLLNSAYEALSDPKITDALGDTALQLGRVLNLAFIPNIRNGQFSLPFARRNDAGPVIIPLSEQQAERAHEIEAQICNKILTSWPTNNRYSPFYGIDVWDEVDDLMHRQMSGDLGTPHGKWSAITTIGFELIDQKNAGATRPAMLIRKEAVGTPQAAAGIVLHEAVHADDAMRDGPLLYETLTYSTATELRGYQVNGVVHPTERRRRIETARQAAADPRWPFAPTPELIALMQAEGAVPS